MLVTHSAVDPPLQRVIGGGREKQSSSAVCDRNGSYQGFQRLFTLVGKPVCLQQRFSSVSSQETVSQLRGLNKTFSYFTADVFEEKEPQTKRDCKIISGGVRRASVHRRQEKPSYKAVYPKKTKVKNQSVTIRQPLVMCIMNLPGNHVSYEEASQMFASTEEAKEMLKRLLASRNHESMMAEPVSRDIARQDQESQSELLEKSDCLQDTYNYLFHRHVQTLNDIIRQQEQQETDEAHGIHHQKKVIQLSCVDGGNYDDDTSVITGSTKSSHNCSTISYHSSTWDGATGSNNQDSNQNAINSNNFIASSTSCSEDNKTLLKDHCKKGERTRVNDNSQSGSSHSIQESATTYRDIRGESSVNINVVSNSIKALQLQEVKVPLNPVITFNHVSTATESSSTDIESESASLRQFKTTSISSTHQSRSSSPLLEVPLPLEDLTSEMMRPPMN
jgi:hypothetical protein